MKHANTHTIPYEDPHTLNNTFNYISHRPPPISVNIVLNIILLKVACVEQANLAVEARIFGSG